VRYYFPQGGGASTPLLRRGRGFFLLPERVLDGLLEAHGPSFVERRHPCLFVQSLAVERTFAWIDQNRRMSKDYERLPESSEALDYVAMSRLLARRLARS